MGVLDAAFGTMFGGVGSWGVGELGCRTKSCGEAV